MKLIFSILLSIIFLATNGQSYNNEWIDYSKTYYKFKVINEKVHRINFSVLQTAGLSTVPAENFQLFRNGEQVPLYVTTPTGPLVSGDFIEFLGNPNDGAADAIMYDEQTEQQNKKYSVVNDTATYYLTTNDLTFLNERYNTLFNNVVGNTLPADVNFTYTASLFEKVQMNKGFANFLGVPLYKSTYDVGEGWMSDFIYSNNTYTATFGNLYADPLATTQPVLKVAYNGNNLNQRTVGFSVNGTTLGTQACDYYFGNTYEMAFSNSLLTANTTVGTTNNCLLSANDRVAVATQQITYKRLFNFGGSSYFPFTLSANSQGNYIEITNFNDGGTLPILYNVSNNTRYFPVITGSTLKFALPAGGMRKFVLVSQAPSDIVNITSLSPITFTNYLNPSLQGNFVILTSKQLHTNVATNAVEQYKAYRSSPAGGSHVVTIIDVEDLYDQFSYGIDRHPMAIRNYLRYAKASFSTPPANILIIGHGTAYDDYRNNINQPYAQQLNMVPTYGTPASDNMLATPIGSNIQNMPIGRLGAINQGEVLNYLTKIKQYELVQADTNFTVANKAWMRNASFVAGSSELSLQEELDSLQKKYRNYWKNGSSGGKGYIFTRTTLDGQAPLSNTFMNGLWNGGQSMLEYFGHSSATTLEYNLDNPNVYTNVGKYPIMVINGCLAGDYFNYDPNRITTSNNISISEKYTFANQRGCVGFIASTNFGVVSYLDYYNNEFYKCVTNTNYGETIGQIMKKSNENMIYNVTNDFFSQFHAQQILLQGDPSIKVNVNYPKPDYAVENSTVTILPSTVSIADTSFTLKVQYYNLAKATNDSMTITVKREFPNGTIATIYSKKVRAIATDTVLSYNFSINPLTHRGINKVYVKLDADNAVDEMSETNNEVLKNITILENEVRPIHPYNYAIVSSMPVTLQASTVNPLAPSRNYIMEIDTTQLFNSVSKQTQTVEQVGGQISYAPIGGLLNNKTYYWRVKEVGSMPIDNWKNFSFTYINGSSYGFNQGHYFQHLESNFNGLTLSSNTRLFNFDSSKLNISIRNGVWPTACTEEGQATISVNQDPYIRGICIANHISFNVFSPVTGLPWYNANVGQPGQYGSDEACGLGREWNFSYDINTAVGRKKAMDFIDMVPAGFNIVIRNTSKKPWWFGTPQDKYIADWKADTAINGSGNSLYHKLYNIGCTQIDSFTKDRAYIFALKKGDSPTKTKQVMSEGDVDRISFATDFTIPATTASITSPLFGPAKSWQEVHWRGTSSETPSSDQQTVTVIGVDANGVETNIMTLAQNQLDQNISGINATQYPYLKLKLITTDTATATPWQLDYWRLNYEPVPEGAVAPNLMLNIKDTFLYNEAVGIQFAFKNLSNANFDSLSLKVVLIDSNNVTFTYILPKQNVLVNGDVLQISELLPITNREGNYSMFISVNPDYEQPEQFLFNNSIFKNIYFRPFDALPVTWLNVQAQLLNSQTKVGWTTANEQNTQKFEIEYSTTGNNFTKIGTVAAAGNSSIPITYNFNHLSPVYGVNYYRIKQIDQDGRFTYSKIVTVLMRDKVKQTIIAPNPVKDVLQIIEPSPVTIKSVMIYSETGALVQQVTVNQKTNYLRLPVTQLAQGNYVISIQYDNEQRSYKFIKH